MLPGQLEATGDHDADCGRERRLSKACHADPFDEPLHSVNKPLVQRFKQAVAVPEAGVERPGRGFRRLDHRLDRERIGTAGGEERLGRIEHAIGRGNTAGLTRLFH